MTLPHTTTMRRITAPSVPYTMFGVSPLAVAKAVCGVGNETSLSVQMTCIHYMPSPLDSVVAEIDMESLLTPSPVATNVML